MNEPESGNHDDYASQVHLASPPRSTGLQAPVRVAPADKIASSQPADKIASILLRGAPTAKIAAKPRAAHVLLFWKCPNEVFYLYK